MPYPEQFEGFMINELGKYQDFRKQSVSPGLIVTARIAAYLVFMLIDILSNSLSQRSSVTTILTSKSSVVVFAALMSIPSPVAGEMLQPPSV